MTYQYTNEDKLQAFDNALKLLAYACYNQVYDPDREAYTEDTNHFAEQLRQMFWNELEHSDEVG